MTQYDGNIRYKGELDLSASEVDELFHAVMHHRERLATRIERLHPFALVGVRSDLMHQYADAEHILILLRRQLVRYTAENDNGTK